MKNNKIINLIVKEVTENETNYEILTNQSICFRLSKKYYAIPKIGDNITMYRYQRNQFRGIDINDERIFYHSGEEMEMENRKMEEKIRLQKQEEFEKVRIKLDNEYELLPDVFKKRIDRFRRNNPNFRLDFEIDEMYCCKEAIRIASSLKSPDSVKSFIDFYKRFHNNLPMKLIELVDPYYRAKLSCTLTLVYDYLENPEKVIRSQGALSEIVGPEVYGDIDK